MPKTAKVRLHLFTDPDFKITVPTRRQTVVSGGNATYRVESDGLGTYVDDTDLDVTGLPEGVDFSFAIDPIGYDASTNLTIDTTELSAGTHEFSIDAEIYTPPQDAIYADSNAIADVKAAINAASPGQMVIVPAGDGTVDWDENLIITKGIVLVGPGSGNLTVTGTFLPSYDLNYFDPANWLIAYQPADPSLDTPFRITGFTFDCNSQSNGIFLFNNSAAYPVTKVRIDHTKIVNQYLHHYPVAVFGTVYGVMDNCEFSNTRCWGSSTNSIWVYNPFYFGHANQFYFEDNVCVLGSQRTLGYGEGGGRYCFRHNAITLTSDMFPLWDGHGNTGGWLATIGVECYSNTIDADENWLGLADERGGKWLLYDNTVTNLPGASNIGVRDESQDSENTPALHSISSQPQHPSESYFWNNKGDGSEIVASATAQLTCSTCGRLEPVENEHFWNYNASFDGSSGIGRGLLSARPSSGLTAGVGYWATDTGLLYRATGATTWETFYTPYTYPHPHRSDEILGD